MSNPIDDLLDPVGKEVEQRMKKDKMKRDTRKSQPVQYTGPDCTGEGEATVETSCDGERHFVEVSIDTRFDGRKTVVSEDDDSLEGALAKAEDAFNETGNGSISLGCLAEDGEDEPG
jgi:hypothetical protein